MQKKTAFITNFCPFYRIKLFKILAEKIGAEFFFFSNASEKNWEQLNAVNDDGLPIVPVLKPGMGKIALLISLFKKLRAKNYDVYIQGISGRFIVPLTFMIAKFRKKPFILWTGFWNHPKTFFHQLTFPIVKFIYKHSDAVVAYGQHVRKYLIGLGVDEKKIFIAQNTADNEIYNKEVFESEINKLKQSLKIEDEKIILFVGRLSKEKGVDILLSAVENLKYKINNLKFLIIGRGAEKENLENYCNKNKLDNVIFLDYVPNNQLYKYYALADIVAVPSITTPVFKEPWGLIVNEAMNQGAIVIASDAVGAAAGGLINNNENGMIVPEGNPELLSDAIMKILRDKDLKKQLSLSAKRTIEKWTYEKMADGFIDAVNYVG